MSLPIWVILPVKKTPKVLEPLGSKSLFILDNSIVVKPMHPGQINRITKALIGRPQLTVQGFG